MTLDQANAILNGLIDNLAALEHSRWSHWQRHLHSTGRIQSDGSIVLPADLVARWDRQMSTEYESLSKEEQESDREQVRRYLPVIAAAFASNE